MSDHPARAIELEAILESVNAALAGQPVSDFEESFGTVRAVLDMRAENIHLREQLEDYRASYQSADADLATLKAENECLRQDLDGALAVLVVARDGKECGALVRAFAQLSNFHPVE